MPFISYGLFVHIVLVILVRVIVLLAAAVFCFVTVFFSMVFLVIDFFMPCFSLAL